MSVALVLAESGHLYLASIRAGRITGGMLDRTVDRATQNDRFIRPKGGIHRRFRPEAASGCIEIVAT